VPLLAGLTFVMPTTNEPDWWALGGGHSRVRWLKSGRDPRKPEQERQANRKRSWRVGETQNGLRF